MKDSRKTKAQLIEELGELRSALASMDSAIAGFAKLGMGIRMYQILCSEIRDLVYVCDPDGRTLFVNRTLERLSGRKPEEFLCGSIFDLFDPVSVERAKEAHAHALKGQSPVFEGVFGETGRICEFKSIPVKDPSGQVAGVMGTATDITERKAARDDLERLVEERTAELTRANERLTGEVAERQRVEQELRKLGTAIEQSVNLVLITDATGRIEYVNPTFEHVTGWSGAEVIGRTPKVLSSGETPAEVYSEMWSAITGGKTWRGVFKNRRKDGEPYWANVIISPIKNDEQRITNFLAVQEDITEKRSSLERIEYLARFDATTGLVNRGWFIELLKNWIRGPEGMGSKGVLLLIDLDQFKFINDTYGHGMGDEFLRRIGKLLEINLRYLSSQYSGESTRENILCRLSGDEFAVFLPHTPRGEGVAIAEQLQKGLEGFYQADVPCHMTASVGCSLFPDHGVTPLELLTKADAAMYRAKELGRNRFHIYSPEDRSIEQMHLRLQWKEKILKALRDDRFEAWYQPIKCLRTGTVGHYEVLARMRSREGGVVLPGPIIDIAERFGLVGSIARAVIVKALGMQLELASKGVRHTFGLNISGKELGDQEFLHFIQSRIYELGADPERIIFEITETASIHDLDSAVRFIRSLKAIGCKIALDDFGIGFTSFLYLKEMQVDFVKIAGPFIKNMDRNLNDQLFVKAITEVARGMDIEVIAEFVESEETAEILREIGVDYAQGYLIGKPSVVPGP